MLEYQKSSAALGLAAQLVVGEKFLNTNTSVRSLGEGVLGGQRFLVLQHEAPAQYTLTQRAQKKIAPQKSEAKKLAEKVCAELCFTKYYQGTFILLKPNKYGHFTLLSCVASYRKPPYYWVPERVPKR